MSTLMLPDAKATVKKYSPKGLLRTWLEGRGKSTQKKP